MELIRATVGEQQEALREVAVFLARGGSGVGVGVGVGSTTSALTVAPPPPPRTAPAVALADKRPADLRAEGNACYARGDAAGAIEWYDRAVAATSYALAGSAPDDGDRCELALALSNRAAAKLRTGAWVSAADDATAALRIDPSAGKAWRRRAAARNALGQHAAAARDVAIAGALLGDAAVKADAVRTAHLAAGAARAARGACEWDDIPVESV